MNPSGVNSAAATAPSARSRAATNDRTIAMVGYGAGTLGAMRLAAGLVFAFIIGGCSAAAPAPGPAATACPSVVTVKAFLAAVERYDGAAARALFAPDGYIETVNVRAPHNKDRVRGDGINKQVTHSPQDYPSDQYREITTTGVPQDCGAVVTFAQRYVSTNPGAPFTLSGKATLSDGKIASVAFDYEEPR